MRLCLLLAVCHVTAGREIVIAGPHSANRLLVHTPSTGEVKGVSTDDIAPPCTGLAKEACPGRWGGITSYNNVAYVSPLMQPMLLIYDAVSGKVSGVNTSKVSGNALGGRWIGTPVVVNGKVYFCPYSADSILIYDIVKGSVSGVSTDGIHKGLFKWYAFTSVGNMLYAAPATADCMLTYDTVSGTVGCISTLPLCNASSIEKGDYIWVHYFKWYGVTTVGKKVYAAPNAATQLLIYDTESDVLSGVNTDPVYKCPLLFGQICYKWHGIAAFGTKVYASPHWADKLLVYDTITGEISGVSTSAVYKGGPFAYAWDDFTIAGGVLYSAPVFAHDLLRYDPATGNVSGVPSDVVYKGTAKYNGITTVNVPDMLTV